MHARHARLAIAAAIVAAVPLTALSSAGATDQPLRILAHAHPSAVLANGTATSTVYVHLFQGWHPDSGASVTLTETAVPSGGSSCGTLAATSGTTGAFGGFHTTYTASSTVGFCTITVTSGTATGSTTIDQIDPTLAAANTHYAVRAHASTHFLKDDGTSTATITYTVLNGTTPVSGDALNVTELSLFLAGACGAISLNAPTTDANGQVVATYTASTTRGICLLRGTEAETAGHSRWIPIFQFGLRTH